MRKGIMALLVCLLLTATCAAALADSLAPDVKIPRNIREAFDLDWMQGRTDRAARSSEFEGGIISLRDNGYKNVYADSSIDYGLVYGVLRDDWWQVDCSAWDMEWIDARVYATIFDSAGNAYRFGWPVEDWMDCTEIWFAPGSDYEMLFLPSDDYASDLVELSWGTGRAYYHLKDGSLQSYWYTARDFATAFFDEYNQLLFVNDNTAADGSYPPLALY